MTKDKRPEPKPRKHPRLWQAYLWWREMNEMKKRHILRLSSIERGKSNLDADFERLILSMFPFSQDVDEDTGEKLFKVERAALKEMIAYGQAVGPIWDWLIAIRGIAEPTAAKLLAQFDDAANYDTVSKFWRFSGYGLYEYWVNAAGEVKAPKDGWQWRGPRDDREHVFVVAEPQPGWTLKRMIDRNVSDWCSPYNKLLKSELWIVGKNFVRSQSPLYVDLYYAEKERQRRLNAERVKVNGKWKFNDGHLDNRARRRMVKIFLQHFWVKWREFDGLPVTEPYALTLEGHSHYIEPFTA